MLIGRRRRKERRWRERRQEIRRKSKEGKYKGKSAVFPLSIDHTFSCEQQQQKRQLCNTLDKLRGPHAGLTKSVTESNHTGYSDRKFLTGQVMEGSSLSKGQSLP